MKPQDIKIGKTYRTFLSRFPRTNTRTVIDFGTDVNGTPVVNYTLPGVKRRNFWLNLKAFARWAGEEVNP